MGAKLNWLYIFFSSSGSVFGIVLGKSGLIFYFTQFVQLLKLAKVACVFNQIAKVNRNGIRVLRPHKKTAF